DAIFPFPEEEYLKDFEQFALDKKGALEAFKKIRDKATTLVQLPRDPLLLPEEPADDKGKEKYWQLRSQAYARLGRFLVGQIDVLVAVWDGKREEGVGG